VLLQCEFDSNSADSFGGAVSTINTCLTVTDSLFYDNFAVQGGAMYLSGTPECPNTIAGTDFSRNSAGVGGALGAVSLAVLNVTQVRDINIFASMLIT
jgi:hypothetical protein